MTALAERLTEFDQQHLLQWWDQLTSEQRLSLQESIEAIDLNELSRLVQKLNNPETRTSSTDSPAARAERATGPGNLIRLPQGESDRARDAAAAELGNQMLSTGQVGVILVAGGQGSRLGFPHPKGMFPIGPVSHSPLFRILAEQLLARTRRAGVPIPLYVMTSHATHAPTVAFFKEHDCFGLDPDHVHFFQQGNMPAVDRQTGRILMADRHELCLSPDGHGGLLKALATSGLLQQMADRGVETLFYHQVDNPTVKVCDPVFLGLHRQYASQLSTRVVAKRSPSEKMGVVVEVDGRTQIIEYSDLPESLADRRDDQGDPVFWAGNTAIHAFERSFLEKLSQDPDSLPFHLAFKNVPYLDTDGQQQSPDDPSHPNAVKFERFIFDALPQAERTLVVEAERDREFNPVKNADGQDSPATAQAALLALHRTWLEQAGATVAADARIEISPLVALDADDLRNQVVPGMELGGDLFMNATDD